MRPNLAVSLCLCAAWMCTSDAAAQLVFGSTTTSTSNPCALYLDVNTLDVTTLWNSATRKKVNGMAADPGSARLYANDAARLNYWDYGSVGIAPTLIGGLYRTDGTNYAATGVDGLAFGNGNLYASTSYQSTTFLRGIYQVGTTPDPNGRCIMTPVWLDPTGVPGVSSGTISLDGLEFNAADNLFYAAQTADPNSSGGVYSPGIYMIDAFGSGACTKIADFPAGRTDIDGLAIGGGRFWLTEQEPGAARIDIYPYDPVTGLYGTTIYVPLTDETQRATGAAWAPGALVPEPATVAALVMLGLVLRRR